MVDRTIDVNALKLRRSSLHDVPGDWFAGPF